MNILAEPETLLFLASGLGKGSSLKGINSLLWELYTEINFLEVQANFYKQIYSVYKKKHNSIWTKALSMYLTIK